VTAVTIVPAEDLSGTDDIRDFLDACPGSFAQQTPAWRDVINGIGEDTPAFLACHDRGALVGVLPAYHFEGPFGAILVSCCQAGPLGGVACLPGAETELVYQALLEAFVELGRQRGCRLATVICNPFQPDQTICRRYLEPDYVLENVTQVLDLQEDLTESGELSKATPALRRNLRKALAEDLQIDDEQSRENVEEWYVLHARRHREIGATPLPKQLFAGALDHLVPREKGRFFFVRLPDSGLMVAGGLYLFHDKVIDSLMPSFSKKYADLRSNHLLIYHSMKWARSRGLRYYNWQPSPPDGGVYRFKHSWGSRDIPYEYLTRVIGNIDRILSATPAELNEAYRWHYVLPFDQLKNQHAPQTGVSLRKNAWEAQSS